MATAKKTNTAPVKLTAAEARQKVEELQEKLDKFESYGYCTLCGCHKKRDDFYACTDPLVKSGITHICKSCTKKLAISIDENGNEISTVESAQLALRYLDKPFITSLWDSSVQESENLLAGKTKSTPWTAYIKNVSMGQYNCMTYFDSDFFKQSSINTSIVEETVNHLPQEAVEDYEKNKKDVIRLLGYDPFEAEALSDQPFLYSQLLGMMDAGGDENDDMVRNASCITIVRGFLQSAKLDNTITTLMSDIKNVEKNSATIKSLQDSKQKITSMITNLAAESCISLKNNKNAKKGENTWTGKIKKIKDLDLRQGRVNGFDMETCKAMRQVMDSSHRSIMQELKLDDTDWSDMVAEQREMIVNLQRKLDKYTEISRILLSENLDLKDFIKDQNIDVNGYSYVNLEDLYSNFACEDEEDENNEDS